MPLPPPTAATSHCAFPPAPAMTRSRSDAGDPATQPSCSGRAVGASVGASASASARARGCFPTPRTLGACTPPRRAAPASHACLRGCARAGGAWRRAAASNRVPQPSLETLAHTLPSQTAALAAVLCLPVARAQSSFTEATAPEYLSFCLEAGTGTVLTGACADASYATFQSYLAAALVNPYGEDNATALAGVDALCSANCDTQLLTLSQRYVQSMPPLPASQSSWCSLVAAPNISPLLQNTLPFLCLRNEADQLCLLEAGKALFNLNLLQQLVAVLEGTAKLDFSTLDMPAICHAMQTTGCCAQTFVDVVQSLLLMTCHPDSAQALSTLFQQCTAALQPGCPYDFSAFAMPQSCPEGGLVLPAVGTECPIPKGSCPVTSCEFLCAVVADDPPGKWTPASSAGARPSAPKMQSAAHTGGAPPRSDGRVEATFWQAAFWIAVAAACMLVVQTTLCARRQQHGALRGSAGAGAEQTELTQKLLWTAPPSGGLSTRLTEG